MGCQNIEHSGRCKQEKLQIMMQLEKRIICIRPFSWVEITLVSFEKDFHYFGNVVDRVVRSWI